MNEMKKMNPATAIETEIIEQVIEKPTEKKTVTVWLKDADALKALAEKNSALKILVCGMTVTAKATVDGKTQTKNVRVTETDLNLDLNSIKNNRKKIIDHDGNGLKDICDMFGVKADEASIELGMKALDRQFKLSRSGMYGVLTRNQMVTLDAIYQVVWRIANKDFSFVVYNHKQNKKEKEEGKMPAIESKILIKPKKTTAKKVEG